LRFDKSFKKYLLKVTVDTIFLLSTAPMDKFSQILGEAIFVLNFKTLQNDFLEE